MQRASAKAKRILRGWDAEREGLTLETWDQVKPEPHWLAIEEYRRAGESVGRP